MAQVEFTEVESDSLINNLIQQNDENNIINKEELGQKEDSSVTESQHVYIVFTDGVSIDQGIEIIENKICQGQRLQVTRRDENGNAIVAIVSSADTKSIENLDEVSLVKIDRGAEKTEGPSADKVQSASKETQTVETQKKESKATSENTTKDETKTNKNTTIDKEQETTENITGTNSEVTTEIRDNIDTKTKPGYTPIAIAVFLGVVILFGIILSKTKR